jgi:hypothetical protein
VQQQFNLLKHKGKKNDLSGGGEVVNSKRKNRRKRKSRGKNRNIIWVGDGRERESERNCQLACRFCPLVLLNWDSDIVRGLFRFNVSGFMLPERTVIRMSSA